MGDQTVVLTNATSDTYIGDYLIYSDFLKTSFDEQFDSSSPVVKDI